MMMVPAGVKVHLALGWPSIMLLHHLSSERNADATAPHDRLSVEPANGGPQCGDRNGDERGVGLGSAPSQDFSRTSGGRCRAGGEDRHKNARITSVLPVSMRQQD